MQPSMFMMVAATVADPTRLRALFALGSRSMTVGELAAEVGVTQGAVSRHVRLMRNAGLIATERRGRCTIVRRRERPWAAVVRTFGQQSWDEV
jgi:DNA-binding transcriptional ArsR family regulator